MEVIKTLFIIILTSIIIITIIGIMNTKVEDTRIEELKKAQELYYLYAKYKPELKNIRIYYLKNNEIEIHDTKNESKLIIKRK